MIPAIGVMVGAYICTRMFAVVVKGSALGDVLVRIAAGATILITSVCVLVLLFSSASLPSSVR